MSELPEETERSWLALCANLMSFGLSAFVVVALLLQLLWLFALVGLGPRSTAGPSLGMARYYPGPLPLGVPAAMIVAGVLLVTALRNRQSGAWLYRTAIAPIPIIGVVSFEILAYRLVGIIAMAVAMWAYSCYAAGRGKLRILVWACIVLVLAGALPFDISLQDVPGGPRWLPTVAGLPSRESAAAAERGEQVIVGGCVPVYTEPTWVWVW